MKGSRADRMLCCAVAYRTADVKNEPVSSSFSDEQEAVEQMMKVLWFEAHETMQDAISPPDEAYLHPVDIDSDEPGIVTSKAKANATEVMRRKMPLPRVFYEKRSPVIKKVIAQPSPPKSVEAATALALKAERKAISVEQRRAKRDIRNEERALQSIARREETKRQRANETPEERNERLDMQRQKRTEKKLRAEESVAASTASHDAAASDVECDGAAADEVSKESDPLGDQGSASDKSSDNLSEPPAALQLSVQELMESESTADHACHAVIPPRMKAREKKIKFYSSPVPFDRHLCALEHVGLHENIRNAILNNEPTPHVRVIHGPPGTGKTRLLAQIAASMSNGRILACAPTNVGAANLYSRILSFIPDASLLMPPSRIPHGVPVTSQDPSGRVVCSTISGRSGPILNDEAFEIVLVDEAAQCMEAWLWSLLRPEVHTIVMVGDTHQLPSMTSEEGVNFLHNRSMMERLLNNGYPSEFLVEQHRMHPHIVQFPNASFYEGRLQTCYTPHAASNLDAYRVIDVDGSCVQIGTSFVNRDEVGACVKLEKDLRRVFDRVVVICPYQAQTRDLLASGIQNVHTIDSFQGQEADAIIVSVVRNGDLGFWSDYRRLNVALTRARHCLRVVGSARRWTGLLKTLTTDAIARDCLVDGASCDLA